ncbi:MAG: VWA domain-containing protein, partial [Gemmatimonadaceae bacterium]
MARKPTRIWDPARRLFIQAQEKAREVITSRNSPASLDDVRPRLQHYLRAMYGESIPIESLAPQREPNVAKRAIKKIGLARQNAASESDAACMRLPSVLPTQTNGISAIEQYRVMAVQHAERMRRASASHSREVTTHLERDLFQLAESATIDAQIIANQPGLRTALETARAESMSDRPKPRFRSAIELRVEEMIRRAWPANGDVTTDTDLPSVPLDNDAESNATWARRTAVALESKYGRKAAQEYRSVPEITLWQTTIRTQSPDEQNVALETEKREDKSAINEQDAIEQSLKSRSAIPGAAKSQASKDSKGNTPQESRDGEASSQSASKDSNGKSDEGAKNDDRTAESKVESSAEKKSGPTKNDDAGNQGPGASPKSDADARAGKSAVEHSEHDIEDEMPVEGKTFRYPEWDFNKQDFHPTGTIVRVTPPSLGPSEWARSTLQEHAREVHLAKQQFERLRSHRSRLRRQVQGDELDLEACVEAMVDRKMHVAPTDRLYSLVRPGRRDLAITLLIDVSGSTGDVVAGEQRVIDIERISAVIATAAFDALGDDYSILAFSSASASNVRVHTLKEFGEKNSSLVLQRISALEPHGTTRLGAAVRHATATLGKHPAPHRLLLILSDGRPFDYDWYFVDYAVQDSRHAILN